ncbi:MAG TPA: hypothetical protein VN999_00410, partial [Thermoanaerobaculia bacterium]|nr:hypothetical protein [Thermoanaerobaculia bacterium]
MKNQTGSLMLPREIRRRRLLATLLALATVVGSGAAGSRARQAAAQPAPEIRPGGLAASQVEAAEGIEAFAAGRDLDAAELLAAATAANPQDGTALHWLGL